MSAENYECHKPTHNTNFLHPLRLLFFKISCPLKGVQKLRSLPFFRETARGIGYSFQLAITTPPINVIGYGTATAQS